MTTLRHQIAAAAIVAGFYILVGLNFVLPLDDAVRWYLRHTRVAALRALDNL